MSGAQEEKAKVMTDPATAPAAGDEVASDASDASVGTPAPSIEGPGLRVRFAGRTAVGLVREHNEDNFVIANLASGEIAPRETTCVDVVTDAGLLFAVCDGMGGAAAGEVASQMAVEILHESLRRGGVPKHRDELARRLVSSVEEAGKRIYESAQKER